MNLKKNKGIYWIFPWFLFAGFVVFLCFQTALAHAEVTGLEESFYTDQQGICYELHNDRSCTVNGYTEDLQSIVCIPQQISHEGITYIVKEIDKTAFQDCWQLKTIEIPDSVTEIPAGIFSDCSKLKEITVTIIHTNLKRTGKNMVISAKISNALAREAGRVKLKVDEGAVEKAVSKGATDTITLYLSAAASEENSKQGTMLQHILLPDNVVRAIAGSGKDFKVRIRDAMGSSCYMKISAESMKQADGALDLTLQQKKTNDTSGSFRTDLKKALQKNNILAGKVKVLEFSFGNGGKADANIIIQAADLSGVKEGSQVYVYRYEKGRRAFAETSLHPYTVTKEGNLNIPISQDGKFVVTQTPFQAMIRKLANEFVTESGNTYYIGKDGNAVCGWRKIGGEYYYFDRENGKMSFGGQVDGIKLNKDGTAKKTNAGVQKIQTMMKARAVMEQVTNASDSKSQKIEKCFRWIFQFPYRRYRRLKPIYRQAGWEVTFANDIFDKHQGCCVSEASAAAFLFHECGYKTVYVACDTGHAWVELNGRVYDPLFAEARGFNQYYNVSYNGYGMRPVEKRKI